MTKKDEQILANMKCNCMRYVPGCYTSNCRNCGLQPKTVNQKSDTTILVEVPIDDDVDIGYNKYKLYFKLWKLWIIFCFTNK